MFTNPFPSSKPDVPRSVPKWVTYMVTRLGTEYGKLEQSSDLTFYSNGVKRKVVINLSSPMASVTTSGSHVSMDNLLGIDFGFWPLKPILATGTPINNFALRMNVKKKSQN